MFYVPLNRWKAFRKTEASEGVWHIGPQSNRRGIVIDMTASIRKKPGRYLGASPFAMFLVSVRVTG